MKNVNFCKMQEKIEDLLNDLTDRQKFLKQSIEEYKISGLWEEAMKCDIRLKTLDTVKIRLEEVLA